jgi:hypothetical protein
MLVNEQTLPRIMGKMPAADWKQCATSRPAWMKEEVEIAFGKSLEQKWKAALIMAVVESAK